MTTMTRMSGGPTEVAVVAVAEVTEVAVAEVTEGIEVTEGAEVAAAMFLK